VFPLSDLCDIADDLVAGDDREGVSEGAGLHARVGVADTDGDEFYENLARRRVLELDVFEEEGAVGRLEDRSLVGLWEGRG